MKIAEKFFDWFYKYQHVQIYVSILNFIMLLALVSDKVANGLNIHYSGFTIAFVVFSLACMSVFGWFMVEKVKAPVLLEKETLKKTYLTSTTFEKLDRIEALLKQKGVLK